MDMWIYRCECGTLHRVSLDETTHICTDCGKVNRQVVDAAPEAPEPEDVPELEDAPAEDAPEDECGCED